MTVVVLQCVHSKLLPNNQSMNREKLIVVSIFNRFLNGRCNNSSCPYFHELIPGKVPTCSYFIKGACGQDNCPYAHSYVGHDAEVCEDFVQGFCAKGIEVSTVKMSTKEIFVH